MKTRVLLVSTLVCSAVFFTGSGCSRQSRGNADADANRAASPAEGGGTSTQASAGDPKNFGDTQAKAQADGRSPSASPTGRSQDANAAHNVQTTGAGASTPAPSPGR